MIKGLEALETIKGVQTNNYDRRINDYTSVNEEYEYEIEIIEKDLDRLEGLEKIFSDSHICEIKERFNEIECSFDKCENCPLSIGDGICLKKTFERKWELEKENQELIKKADCCLWKDCNKISQENQELKRKYENRDFLYQNEVSKNGNLAGKIFEKDLKIKKLEKAIEIIKKHFIIKLEEEIDLNGNVWGRLVSIQSKEDEGTWDTTACANIVNCKEEFNLLKEVLENDN